MPTYPYRCTACDHKFEVVQSFSDAPLTVCPVCAGPLRKVFSSVGIVFKGPGFYRTDSRSSTGSKGTIPANGTSGNGKPAAKDGGEKPAAASSTTSGGDKTGTPAASTASA